MFVLIGELRVTMGKLDLLASVHSVPFGLILFLLLPNSSEIHSYLL